MPAQTFDYAAIAPKVKSAVRKAFPEDTIIIQEGYLGRVHLKVVSERFNGMSERGKQEYIWDILRAELEPEAQEAVSLAVAYSADAL